MHISDWIGFKGLFAGAWAVTLWMVDRLLLGHGTKVRVIGLIVLGWLPISTFEAVAEAHNDSVVAMLIVSWIFLRQRRHPLSGVPLVMSILAKYAPAPLGVLAAYDVWRGRRWLEIAVLTSAILAAALWIALLWHHGRLLAGLSQVEDRRFFSRTAIDRSPQRADRAIKLRFRAKVR